MSDTLKDVAAVAAKHMRESNRLRTQRDALCKALAAFVAAATDCHCRDKNSMSDLELLLVNNAEAALAKAKETP